MVSWSHIPKKVEELAGKRIFAWWVGGCMASLQWQMGSSIFRRCEWTWSNIGALAGCEPQHLPWTFDGLALSREEMGKTLDRPSEIPLAMLSGGTAWKV